jgi:hypothetical protein
MTQYGIGSATEYKLRDLFLACGKRRLLPSELHPLFGLGAYNVMRAAGSHGPYDLVVECPAFDIWIQVKHAKTLNAGRAELKRLAQMLRADKRPRPDNRIRAGIVYAPRRGLLVAVSNRNGCVECDPGRVYADALN